MANGKEEMVTGSDPNPQMPRLSKMSVTGAVGTSRSQQSVSTSSSSAELPMDAKETGTTPLPTLSFAAPSPKLPLLNISENFKDHLPGCNYYRWHVHHRTSLLNAKDVRSYLVDFTIRTKGKHKVVMEEVDQTVKENVSRNWCRWYLESSQKRFDSFKYTILSKCKCPQARLGANYDQNQVSKPINEDLPAPDVHMDNNQSTSVLSVLDEAPNLNLSESETDEEDTDRIPSKLDKVEEMETDDNFAPPAISPQASVKEIQAQHWNDFHTPELTDPSAVNSNNEAVMETSSVDDSTKQVLSDNANEMLDTKENQILHGNAREILDANANQILHGNASEVLDHIIEDDNQMSTNLPTESQTSEEPVAAVNEGVATNFEDEEHYDGEINKENIGTHAESNIVIVRVDTESDEPQEDNPQLNPPQNANVAIFKQCGLDLSSDEEELDYGYD